MTRNAAALALAWALAPVAVSAQAPSDTVVYAVPGITVTALRAPAPRMAVPLNVSVLEGTELRARGIRTIAEALDGLPGITVVETGSYGGTASLFVRGGESDYARVLVDGVPVNAPGGGLDLAHLTVENVERIEVVRGPGSVLYGSDAVAAVIEIHTRRGSGAPVVDARARAGSHGTLDLAASVGGGRGSLSYSGSIANLDTDGTLPFNNDYRNTELSARLGLDPDRETSLALTVRHSDHDLHYPTDGSGALVDRNRFTAGARTVVGLDAARTVGPVRAELSLGAHDSDEGIRDDFDDGDDTDALRTNDHARRLMADARAHVDIAPRTVLTVGGLLERETLETDLSSQSSFGPFESASDDRRATRAGYAQLYARPAAGASLTGGVRYEDNDAFGSFSTWRAGASYAPVPALRLRASAGTGFKEPTFAENFARGFARGNPDLAPEESRSWELGLDATTDGGRVTFSATYFDQEFRNLIDFTFAPMPDTAPNYFNIARASSRGLEASAGAKLGAGLSLDADWTWLDTEALDPGFDASGDAQFAPGRPLLRRPRHTWSARLGRRGDRLRAVSVEGRRVGEREDLDFSGFPALRVRAPGYFVMDASAEVALLSRDRGADIAAVLRIENLFDERYANPVGFEGRGFGVLAGLRARLGG